MWWPKRSRTDFSSELQSHLALEVDRLRAEGLSDDEAHWQARKSFGNVTQTEENFYRSNRPAWFESLRQDGVYALRQLVKDKTFTLVAVATLALGIGCTTAIFTLVHATLLKALPYRDANRIISINDERLNGQSTGGLVGVPRFFDLQAQTHSFESLAFYYFDHPTMIAGSSLPTPLTSAGVSGDFFKTIGIQPALGRAFTRSEDRVGAPEVAVISYTTWQRVFSGRRDVINQQVKLDGKLTTIVGVMSPKVEFPSKIEIWVPAHFDSAQGGWTYRGDWTRFINVIGRLRRDVSLSTAQAELQLISTAVQRKYPATDGAWRFSSEPLRELLYGGVKPALLMLLAASGLLLLIACTNVANLQLSRATTRTREVALRRALGASQLRIVLQFLTENTLLSIFGGALGLAAAFVLVRWLGDKLPGSLGTAAIDLDWQAVCFTLGVSVFIGIIFGLAPALQGRHLDLNTNLKQGDLRTGATTGSRVRSAFISIEVALSLVLLIGASLLSESLWNLMKSPMGFEPDHVLTFHVSLPRNTEPGQGRHFYTALQRKLSALPGVSAVGQISALPTVDWHLRSNFDVDWKPGTPRNDAVSVEYRNIAGDYLAAMRIPLLAGRNLDARDADEKMAPLLVNQEFVRRYAPANSILGHHLVNKDGRFEIAGVIGNVRGTAGSIANPVGPEVYFPAQNGYLGGFFVVRTQLPPNQLISTIRQEVHQLDSTQAVREVATLDERLDKSISQPRFNMGLLTSFAAMALLLACVGIYGVVSYSAKQRSLEVGIRIALGATRVQISSLLLRSALVAAIIGLAFGGVAALLLTRLLRSQLYNVEPNHPFTFIVSTLLLLTPVLLASLRPALQAAWLNPVDALRRD